jgi:two-component system sensor histidine kinase UhpB
VRGDRKGAKRPGSSRGARHSLLWWVYLGNAAVLVVAFLLIAFTPIEIHASPKLGQLLILMAGLTAALAINLLLMRWALWPLMQFTELMETIDPENPGRRLDDTSLRGREAAAMAGAFNSMLDRLERSRQDAARSALAAQEAERLRVARELHDEVGQSLTAAMIRAEHALDTSGASSEEDLHEIVDTLRDSLDDVRRIARELRPEALDDLGLTNALIALCSRIGEQGSLAIRRDFAGKLPALSPEVELVVYRVAQEGLTNVLRHADASEATLSLEVADGQLRLSLVDDGVGMPSPLPPDTVGIAGMRERARLLDGRLWIGSQPGAGTGLRLTLPLDAR